MLSLFLFLIANAVTYTLILSVTNVHLVSSTMLGKLASLSLKLLMSADA